MKKIINIKEIMIILISVLVITFSTTAFASDLVLGNNSATTITGNEYDNAQTVPEDNNTVNNTINNNTNNTNNSVNNNTNNTNNNVNNNTNNNTAKTYNTNNSNNTDLPQTGIEDYNIGILLVICIASAIFAYKKITDYKNI